MKKTNLLFLCIFMHNAISSYSTNTQEQNVPKIFQDIRSGNKKAIQQQLENGADFTEKDNEGNTALHIAAQEGEDEILRTIVEYYDNCGLWTYYTTATKLPELDEVNKDGDTILHSAICYDNDPKKNAGRIKIAEYLAIKQPNLIKKTNNKNFSPAFTAITIDYPQFIELFRCQQLNLNNHKQNGETIFTYAIKEKKPNTIHYCLHHTSLNNIANNDNKTPIELVIDIENIDILNLFEKNLNSYIANTTIKPIHYAAAQGKYGVINYLKNRHISINEPDKDGNPPLFHAIDNNNEKMVNYLKNIGANLEIRNNAGEDAFAIAIYNKHFDLIDTLKNKYNVPINGRDNKGRTSLMRASIEQNHDVMEKLINLGVSPRIADNTGENILHKIVRNGDQKGVYIALKYDKLLLSDADQDGNLPIFTAIQNDQCNLAEILINAGSPINNINKKEETILHEIAKKNSNPLLAKILHIINPVLINHQNKSGESAIFFAAHNNNAIGIRTLTQHNAKCRYITNIHGLTPLHDAATTDAIDAIIELERHGASLTDCTPTGNTAAHIAANYGSIKTIRYSQSKNGLLEIRNNNGENVFSRAALSDKLEVTKLLLREEYFTNDLVSHVINSLKNSSLKNSSTLYFLIREDENRINRCRTIYSEGNQAKMLIDENQRLSQNNPLYALHYKPSKLDGKSVDTLYHMNEADLKKIEGDYKQAKNHELTINISFKQDIARIQQEKQNALDKQNATELAQKEKDRIIQQQKNELNRIALENQKRADQEQARLQEELQCQQQAAERDRIAAIDKRNGESAPVKPAKMRHLAANIRSQQATPEEITLFITESKKIIASNVTSQKISIEEAKELLKIAILINNAKATQPQINSFIEKIKKFIEDND